MIEYEKRSSNLTISVESYASNAYMVSVNGDPWCYADNLKEASDEVARIMRGDYWVVTNKGINK